MCYEGTRTAQRMQYGRREMDYAENDNFHLVFSVENRRVGREKWRKVAGTTHLLAASAYRVAVFAHFIVKVGQCYGVVLWHCELYRVLTMMDEFRRGFSVRE